MKWACEYLNNLSLCLASFVDSKLRRMFFCYELVFQISQKGKHTVSNRGEDILHHVQ